MLTKIGNNIWIDIDHILIFSKYSSFVISDNEYGFFKFKNSEQTYNLGKEDFSEMYNILDKYFSLSKDKK